MHPPHPPSLQPGIAAFLLLRAGWQLGCGLLVWLSWAGSELAARAAARLSAMYVMPSSLSPCHEIPEASIHPSILWS